MGGPRLVYQDVAGTLVFWGAATAIRWARAWRKGVHIIRLWQPAVAAAVILARALGLLR